MSGYGRGGRGAYYKARYGNQRGTKRFNQDVSEPEIADRAAHSSSESRDWDQLKRDLSSIDGRGYGHYKQLMGKYEHAAPKFVLSVDHVQSDAYAPPSRVRIVMPWAETGMPTEYLASDIRRIAVADFVTRIAGSNIQRNHLNQNVGNANGGWSGPKGGAFSICMPGQQVLARTSAIISKSESTIELRFTVALPAVGRTVLGKQAHQILVVNLVRIAQNALLFANIDAEQLAKHVSTTKNQQYLRTEAQKHKLIAFVANRSILPRTSGASQSPMSAKDAITFQSPKELETTLKLPNGTAVAGMGIPPGVTLLTGGGFHGKSTLLQALELGVYNHIFGDGRELVVTDPSVVKVRAEDGRGVSKIDISPFIRNLPGRRDTTSFSTSDASGSTSMASNIQEAVEAGSKLLLIDEDSSATNLLVRDQRMQQLIQNEPITPLVSKARALYDQHGVSTILVIGGLGDFLSVADNVILLDSYKPHCITQKAQALVQRLPTAVPQDTSYGSVPNRAFKLSLSGFKTPFASRKKFITFKKELRDAVDDPSQAESGVDIGRLDQIVEIGQSRMIAEALRQIECLTKDRALTFAELKDSLDRLGTDKVLPTSLNGGDLVGVRPIEVAAALSRVRGEALSVEM